MRRCAYCRRMVRINGAALRDLREARGLTIADLAGRVGVGHPHLSRVERGINQASPALIRQLADVLHVDVLSLLGPSNPDEATAEIHRAEVRR